MPHRSRMQAIPRKSAHRFNVNTSVAATLLLGWAAISLAAFATVDARGVLDFPVGALLAGQGGLMALVLLGVTLRDRKR